MKLVLDRNWTKIGPNWTKIGPKWFKTDQNDPKQTKFWNLGKFSDWYDFDSISDFFMNFMDGPQMFWEFWNKLYKPIQTMSTRSFYDQFGSF